MGGETQVPEGYTTFREAGVAFARPEGWAIERQPSSDQGVRYVITQAAPDATPAAGISLTVTEGVDAERFQSGLDQSRSLTETQGGELVSDEEVEIEGAAAAVRTVIEFPATSGSDPVPVRTTKLEILSRSRRVILSVPVPQRGGEPPVDPEVVLSTFRLEW